MEYKLLAINKIDLPLNKNEFVVADSLLDNFGGFTDEAGIEGLFTWNKQKGNQ